MKQQTNEKVSLSLPPSLSALSDDSHDPPPLGFPGLCQCWTPGGAAPQSPLPRNGLDVFCFSFSTLLSEKQPAWCSTLTIDASVQCDSFAGCSFVLISLKKNSYTTSGCCPAFPPTLATLFLGCRRPRENMPGTQLMILLVVLTPPLPPRTPLSPPFTSACVCVSASRHYYFFFCG